MHNTEKGGHLVRGAVASDSSLSGITVEEEAAGHFLCHSELTDFHPSMWLPRLY